MQREPGILPEIKAYTIVHFLKAQRIMPGNEPREVKGEEK